MTKRIRAIRPKIGRPPKLNIEIAKPEPVKILYSSREINITTILEKLSVVLFEYYYRSILREENEEILKAKMLIDKIKGFYFIAPEDFRFRKELILMIIGFKPDSMLNLDIKKLNQERLSEILFELRSSSATYKDFALKLGLSVFKYSNSINRG